VRMTGAPAPVVFAALVELSLAGRDGPVERRFGGERLGGERHRAAEP
jgi:hypothetical protein